MCVRERFFNNFQYVRAAIVSLQRFQCHAHCFEFPLSVIMARKAYSMCESGPCL